MKQRLRFLSESGRFVFVLLLLAITYIFAMFQGGKVSWSIFYILLPFVLYSCLLFFYPLRDMKAGRKLTARTLERGGKLEVRLEIERHLPFPLLYTVASEKWEDPAIAKLMGEKGKRLFLFGFRKKVEWSYVLEDMPRGEHVLSGIEIEVSDFFGWIRKSRIIDMKDAVLVFPKMKEIHYVPIKAQYDRGTLASPFSLVKDTTMATGVRDYQSGDRVTWIHWKSFARTQTLMTKEFEDRQSEELTIILDGRKSKLFEEEIELAASILKEATSKQANVSFLSVGEKVHHFPLLQSAEHLRNTLVHLAKLKPDVDVLPEAIDFSMTMASGGSVILISSEPDWSFIQPIVTTLRNVQAVICFAVVDRQQPLTDIQLERIQYLRTKGITVHVLGKTEFAEAFREVAS
ncbi:hypothetical protein NCCP2222_23120 [Sporosarcina sp. NCCP-2222]|uniref:DUF58 domain-containing protein n=1 Tax=Sporosarcina sp. NCCP-2222 TaxID=2935073 RepID=UPI0020804B2E|nr:DUF58 domain-containing protein [Sporosarcina sp. NCCP-2222]GKV56365.1 hypothetical protein NCCP2222_23120 [Sporosarcina sp. NCCP-2222]